MRIPHSLPAVRRVLCCSALGILLPALLLAGCGRDTAGGAGKAPVTPVVSAVVSVADVPVVLTANGTVTAVQSVDVRAQLSATIKTVHVREGQFVKQGERLFTLDAQAEAANFEKAQAQANKSRTELANAERSLRRQQELFAQKFISQTALDTAQSLADSWRAQLAADVAAAEAARVARNYAQIVAPIAGRTGAVVVYPGTLVQPSGAALVSIAQIDPIQVSFTLPERELPALQKAMHEAAPVVEVQPDDKMSTAPEGAARTALRGTLVFLDNAVDSTSGTIRAKASFTNTSAQLWPGMFVKVRLAARTLKDALTVPVQAVQTGPEKKFVYTIDGEGKVSDVAVRVLLVQDGLAVIDGVPAGTKVVAEGAQGLRPGSKVSEATKQEPTENQADKRTDKRENKQANKPEQAKP